MLVNISMDKSITLSPRSADMYFGLQHYSSKSVVSLVFVFQAKSLYDHNFNAYFGFHHNDVMLVSILSQICSKCTVVK